jgi:hypothetical protein
MSAMVHVVLVYQREEGRLHLQESYDDGETAMRRRFVLERLPEYADMEVVVLSADSIETLHETHSRYFYTVSQLVQKLREALDAA